MTEEKEKGKEEKSRQRICLEEGNVGHGALMCERKTRSPPSRAPFQNLIFFSNSSLFFLSRRKADKSTIFNICWGEA